MSCEYNINSGCVGRLGNDRLNFRIGTGRIREVRRLMHGKNLPVCCCVCCVFFQPFSSFLVGVNTRIVNNRNIDIAVLYRIVRRSRTVLICSGKIEVSRRIGGILVTIGFMVAENLNKILTAEEVTAEYFGNI